MGETAHWDEFRDHNDKTGAILNGVASGAKILFGQSFDEALKSLAGQAANMDLIDIANQEKPGGKFDIKNDLTIAPNGPKTGKLLHGMYATARSAGNYLAGYNGALGTLGGAHISWETFQKMAGALHALGHVSKAQMAGILIFGNSYGSAPWYGEIEYQGGMSQEGF